MKGIKKLNLCLFSFLTVTGLFATASATVLSQRTTQHGGWYVELEGFDAEINTTFLSNFPIGNVASMLPVSLPPISNVNALKHAYLSLDKDLGFQLVIGYDFPSCFPFNYGFSLEYTHLNNPAHDLREVFIPLELPTTTQTSQILPYKAALINAGGGSTYTAAKTKYDASYNTLDFLSHYNNIICKQINTQLFIGARYLTLREDYHQHFYDRPVRVRSNTSLDDFIRNFDSKYNGVGPRIGIAGFYPFTCNLGLTVELAGNLLFGSSESHYSEYLRGVPDQSITFFRRDQFIALQNEKTKVVPGWSAKVGVAFRKDFQNLQFLFIVSCGNWLSRR